MSRRCHQREKAILKVRIWGMDAYQRPFSELAHTLDVTPTAARLGNVRPFLRPGEIVGVLRNGVKARFMVRWVGQPDSPRTGQVGVECIEQGKCIWDIKLPISQPSSPQPDAATQVKAPTPALEVPPSGISLTHAPLSQLDLVDSLLLPDPFALRLQSFAPQSLVGNAGCGGISPLTQVRLTTELCGRLRDAIDAGQINLGVEELTDLHHELAELSKRISRLITAQSKHT